MGTRVLIGLLCVVGVLFLLAGVAALPVGAAGVAAPPPQPSPRPPWNATMTPSPGPSPTPTPVRAAPVPSPTPTEAPALVLLPVSGNPLLAASLIGLGVVCMGSGMALALWGRRRRAGE
ncbi:MAG TPA: hypothetical protein G4O00_10015 [Thermoflexia bacterium]|nr:hypothetical protein [Thermoflexia bacterium]